MPVQIANGAQAPCLVAGTPMPAQAAGEIEREAMVAKTGTAKTGAMKAGTTQAGATQAGGAKMAAAKTAAVSPAAQVKAGSVAKAAAGVGKVAGTGVKTAGVPLLTGKGLSLGLGLGLGAWGPVIVGVAGAAAVYAYLKSRSVEAAQSDEEAELRDALA